MALTDALIGDKPVKVEVDISDNARNIIVVVLFFITVLTISVLRSKKTVEK